MTKNSQYSNSPLSEKTSAVPKMETSADIFSELRERKRKEPKVAPSIPVEDSTSPTQPNILSRLLVAALFGAIMGFACTFLLTGAKATPAKSQGAQKQASKPVSKLRSNGSDLKIEVLKSTHAAVDWEDSIHSSRRENPFSIELEDAFIRSDAQPVLVRCTLLDIAYGNLGIVAKFGIPGASEDFANVLILETRKEQLKIFDSALRGMSEYAVVAKCTRARDSESGGRIIEGRLIDVVELDGK